MKWMQDAATMLGSDAAATAEFALKAAPYVIEAGEMLAPLALLMEQPKLVSAKAELRRYHEVLQATEKFGDVEIAQMVKAAFKEATDYYQAKIEQGSNYVPHFKMP